ncbi:hypothetical protein GCM10009868_17160 [Terrabacter aerolatus]|uniref:DUF2974 domain-containing protein n=1 Tax=Terrabacter aerolatus TaxID=422442 RepID=A0A512D247_9MICO|nr:WXG100 family type VII secretion target [Terrabacter aerolatus]GEO30538.1 hypothetical protein TAE01_23480 [Terrabacter aerolatus]
MLYRKGADPEALERSARELTACAAEVDGIRSTGSRALAAIGRSWGGDDAQSAQDSWRATSASLTALGSTLESMSRRLTDNARSQRGASQAGAGAPGLPVPPAPGRPSALLPWLGGAVVRPTSFADQARGTSPRPIDLTLADIADNVYHPSRVDGWSPLDAGELRTLGIDPAGLHTRDGFDAAVYRNADGRYVLAYAGTTTMSDWRTNAEQGVGLPSEQHLRAIHLAQDVSRSVGAENMVITGHSLGGGLASTASIATDVPAVTFNAAGVHPHTVAEAREQGGAAAAYSPDQIRNYHVRGEMLTTLQNPLGSFVDHAPPVGDTPLPNALGTQIALDPAHGPEITPSRWSVVASTAAPNLAPAIRGVDAGLDLLGWSVGAHSGSSVVDAMQASAYFGTR